jgi:hypothetical protein
MSEAPCAAWEEVWSTRTPEIRKHTVQTHPKVDNLCLITLYDTTKNCEERREEVIEKMEAFFTYAANSGGSTGVLVGAPPRTPVTFLACPRKVTKRRAPDENLRASLSVGLW